MAPFFSTNYDTATYLVPAEDPRVGGISLKGVLAEEASSHNQRLDERLQSAPPSIVSGSRDAKSDLVKELRKSLEESAERARQRRRRPRQEGDDGEAAPPAARRQKRSLGIFSD